jgi:glycosyltransferase involved in cell wall biosynthesis
VLLHDTIPLEHPEFCRADTIKSFADKIASVSHHADLVIHTAESTRQLTEAHLARHGRVPEGLVARLGVTLAPPLLLPFIPKSPYFVSLGTIEPRKNHALLLQVWSQLPTPVPELYIVGARGWADADLLARLDALPQEGPIKMITGLGDGEVRTLLQGARALLFPSFAEGFGIPALEAAALGTSVVLSDLPVFKELLSHSAVYLAPEASYSWLETIARLTAQEQTLGPVVTPPTWEDHFNQVFTLLS